VIEKEKQKQQQKQQKLRNPIPGLIINPDLNREKKSNNKNEAIFDNISKKVNIKRQKERSHEDSEASVSNLAHQLSDTMNIDPTVEISKKLKRLRKRLREIELLQEKIMSGEIKNPEKDQLEKVERRDEIYIEIQTLEEERKKIHDTRENK
jgi:partner of Y14 and mago protein